MMNSDVAIPELSTMKLEDVRLAVVGDMMV
jgi:hypothetical protein